MTGSRVIERRVFLAGLLGITLLAGTLRFEGLVNRELWLDESCTSYWVNHFNAATDESASPWREPAHVPYFFLLRLWTRVMGDDAWGLRSFSAFVGTLTVAAVGALAALLSGRRVGILVALLAAVHPLHLYYCQEARAYSLWVLCITLATYFLIRAAKEGRIMFWAGYMATSVIAYLVHYYTLLWMVATLAASGIAPSRKDFVKHWSIGHTVLALLLLAPAWFWMRPYMQTGPSDWQRDVWKAYPPWLAIPRSLWGLLPSGGYPASYLAPLDAAAASFSETAGAWIAPTIRWLPAALLVIVMVGIIPSTRQQRRKPEAPESAHSPTPIWPGTMVLLAGLSLGYLALVWLISAFVGRGYLVGRYDMAAWPSFLIALATLIERWSARFSRQRDMMLALVFLLASCSLATWIGYHREPVIHVMHERARRIAEVVHPTDLVISVGMYRWFVDHEWRTIGFSADVRSFPSRHDRQLCWRNVENEVTHAQVVEHELESLMAAVKEALKASRRVWVLWLADPADPTWRVDGRFLNRVLESRFEIQPVDEWVGLMRILDRTDQTAGAG